MAREPKPHTNYSYLSHQQLCDILEDVKTDRNRLKLQNLTDTRKITRQLAKLSEHKRLIMTVTDLDPPRAGHIIQTHLKHGSSMSAIIDKLGQAVTVNYNPRGFSQNDFLLVLFLFRIGGGRLVFVMHRALGLPSLRALKNNMMFTKITPVIGTITADPILQNIRNVVIMPREKAQHLEIRGVSLSIDETAAEERACHDRKTNSVIGLCWNHSHLVDPVLRTYESALTIKQKLIDGEVHLGKEVSVVAASFFGVNHLWRNMSWRRSASQKFPEST
ncbi:hypothetical protein BV22DRAFT_1132459 [Leucogyrophana mollusca]|uniref:Uncharacterized protein n=1 Tax=Leucogyrophana mollusca TaxID=85980 RepID=A0ACB8B8J8_9AGAM|nr:hypothetical protein BV22DRAFT_1132459 [Leucogyrophana mollusca]